MKDFRIYVFKYKFYISMQQVALNCTKVKCHLYTSRVRLFQYLYFDSYCNALNLYSAHTSSEHHQANY
jgi:hypothetical protein